MEAFEVSISPWKKLFLIPLVCFLSACNAVPEIEQDLEVATLVQVAELETGKIPEVLTFGGRVKAMKQVDISVNSSGKVQSVEVQDGDKVEPGQALVYLRSGPLENQLREQEASIDASRSEVALSEAGLTLTKAKVENQIRQAEEQVRQAKIAKQESVTTLDSDKHDLTRLQGLLEQEAVAGTKVEQARLQVKLSEAKVKDAESKVTAAQENLRLAQRNRAEIDQDRARIAANEAQTRKAEAELARVRQEIAHTTIRAEIAGVIVGRSVEPGQSVSPGDKPLLKILDLDSLEVMAQADQRHYDKLQPGLIAELMETDRTIGLVLKEVVPSTVDDSSNLDLRFQFSEKVPDELVDGMTAQIRLRLGDSEGILVPKAAVHQQQGGLYAWLVMNNQASRRSLKKLAEDETFIVVAPGEIRAGDKVVVQGSESLVEGDRVRFEK